MGKSVGKIKINETICGGVAPYSIVKHYFWEYDKQYGCPHMSKIKNNPLHKCKADGACMFKVKINRFDYENNSGYISL